MPTILLAPPAADLRAALAGHGFEVVETSFVAPGPAAVVVVLGEPVGPAAAFVRRVKAVAPVLWLSPPEFAAAGLDAGAVAVLPRSAPADVLAAQVRALMALGERVADLEARADEARQRNAELRAAYADIDRGVDVARRVRRLLLPAKLPEIGPVRLAVHHRPRPRAGCVLYDAVRIDDHRVGVWVAEVGGPAVTAGWVGVAVKHAAAGPGSPAEVLGRVNRALLDLGLDPPPLVGMIYALIDARTGGVAVSRGGVPPPVRVPADGPADVWGGPGPFLGAFDADFPAHTATLLPGEKLVLRTGTPAADADPVPPAAVRHRPLTGTAFADAVARDVGMLADGDELTLVVVEV